MASRHHREKVLVVIVGQLYLVIVVGASGEFRRDVPLLDIAEAVRRECLIQPLVREGGSDVEGREESGKYDHDGREARHEGDGTDADLRSTHGERHG